MDRLLFLASSFMCTKQTMIPFDFNDECAFITYIIERGHLVEGRIIDKLQANAFQDCLQHCSKERRCTGVNFLIDVKDEPVCLFIDRTGLVNESEMPIPESVIYSATPFCLTQKLSSYCTDNTTWSFEKFPKRDIIDDKFVDIAKGAISLEKCLTTCLEREQCRATLYNKKSAQCRYLNVSIQNVHNMKRIFKGSEEVDLYENNCFPGNLIADAAQCQFIRMQSSGFTDFFDERVTDVSGETECQQLCIAWDRGTCRYFTYQQGARICYLSHTSPRTLNKNPLENYDSNLTSGDLEDCIQFSLTCKPDRMHIHGTSLKMFSGTLKAKNDKIYSCERKFLHVYEFDAEMLYNDCGMQKAHSPYLTFSNLVMLKEGSTELITVKDKLLKVICYIHNDLEVLPKDQHLSFQFQIEDENATKQMMSKSIQITSQLRNHVARPRYTMEVMDVNKHPAKMVQMGDKGYLLLTLHEKPIKFSIIDLSARDTKSGRTFTIIDSNGCAVPDGMLKDILRIDKNHLQMTIIFDGFPDEVVSFIKNRVRKRRSIMTASESRLFQLSGDIYTVKSSNKLKIRQKSKKAEAESNGLRTKSVMLFYEESIREAGKNEEEKLTIISQLVCIAEDVKCLIAFLALCFQALVLLMIIAITYTIIQHCVRQQRNSGTLQLSQNIENKNEAVRRLSES
uniref:Apple domain-containing protein n=1 Tax=Setaria digitata TaxID=48799 RepID=A0A915PPP5_9BILA